MVMYIYNVIVVVIFQNQKKNNNSNTSNNNIIVIKIDNLIRNFADPYRTPGALSLSFVLVLLQHQNLRALILVDLQAPHNYILVQNLQQPKGQHWNRGIVMTTSNTPRKGTAALHILYQTRVFRLYDVVCNRWGRTNPPV